MVAINSSSNSNNNSDHEHGSIQVVPIETSDESSSLLQHRHPPTAAQQDDEESAAVSTEPLLVDTPFSPSFGDYIKRYWNKYVHIVERHPLLTKSITATIILGGADCFAQAMEHARGVASTTPGIMDWPRAARFACFGLFGAPWSHYYFAVLDYYIPPSNQASTIIIKVVIDQFVQAPILLAVMISVLALLKGEGIKGVKDDLSENFVHALIANWKLWLPASAINMILVKPSLRVLYVNVVFFLWTIILSLMLNAPSS